MILQLYQSFLTALGTRNQVTWVFDLAHMILLRQLEQTASNPSAISERTLLALAREYDMRLTADRVPDLQPEIAKIGIVYVQRSVEDFCVGARRHLHDQGLVRHEWSSPLQGEDQIRCLVRNLLLLRAGREGPVTYDSESARREALNTSTTALTQMVGKLNVRLIDYYRLCRNAAVHGDDEDKAARLAQIFDELRGQAASTTIHRRHAGKSPRAPDELRIDDAVIYSKVAQDVAWALCLFMEPAIEAEVLPSLTEEFARFGNPDRRRNAMIGALRTRYKLDRQYAETIVDRHLAD